MELSPEVVLGQKCFAIEACGLEEAGLEGVASRKVASKRLHLRRSPSEEARLRRGLSWRTLASKKMPLEAGLRLVYWSWNPYRLLRRGSGRGRAKKREARRIKLTCGNKQRGPARKILSVTRAPALFGICRRPSLNPQPKSVPLDSRVLATRPQELLVQWTSCDDLIVLSGKLRTIKDRLPLRLMRPPADKNLFFSWGPTPVLALQW